MFLSKTMRETDQKSRALLTDLVLAVQDEQVAQDPEFIKLLEDALSRAEQKATSAKTDQARLEEKPKEVASP